MTILDAILFHFLWTHKIWIGSLRKKKKHLKCSLLLFFDKQNENEHKIKGLKSKYVYFLLIMPEPYWIY